MSKTSRIKEIDIIKGIGIICMVACHAGSPCRNFIYLFHMAIFFIASGYTYNSKNTDTFNSYIKYVYKKMKQLYIPFVFWNVLFILLNNFFIDINVYTDSVLFLDYYDGQYASLTNYLSLKETIVHIKNILMFNGETQLGGAFWFLRNLFYISLLYGFNELMLKRITKKIKIYQNVISILLLLIGFYFRLRHNTLNGFALVFSYYCLFHIGTLLRLFDFGNIKKSFRLIIIIGSFSILLVMNNFASFELGKNAYGNPIYLLIASLSGWFMLYQLATFICETHYIYSALTKIGQNTLIIMSLHFLSFKLVSLIKVIVMKKPMFCIAAFPTYYGEDGLWWILYTIIGIALPMIINKPIINIKNRLIKKALI